MKYVIGIDEVGRGCLAGPVTVAAVAVPRNLKFKIPNLKLRDSKKLTAKQREEWFAHIKKHPKILHAWVHMHPKSIDRLNVSGAANLAATKALLKLIAGNPGIARRSTNIFLDGGLFLNPSLLKKFPVLGYATVVKADEKYTGVKLASIVAKVSRDRMMRRYHRKFPEYGFDRHVGYATRTHIKAVKQRGICPLHRLTFVKNFV